MADVKLEPKITIDQLNRRGACLSEIAAFQRMFGQETVVTVVKALSVAHIFDFGWATHELLHEPHCREVIETILKRCVPPPDKENWTDGSTLITEVYAEEFARKYIEVYPNVT